MREAPGRVGTRDRPRKPGPHEYRALQSQAKVGLGWAVGDVWGACVVWVMLRGRAVVQSDLQGELHIWWSGPGTGHL